MALFYAATVILQMSEAEFWRCTLRRLYALYKHHIEREEVRRRQIPQAVLDAVKAHQLKKLFEEYVSGSGLEAAAEKIGIHRQHASLGKMVENRFYIGDEFYPAIVDEELWNKAQAERKRRAEALGRDTNYFSRDKSAISPFWGMVFCSKCGSEYRRYADHGKKRWRCGKRIVNGKLSCNSPMIRESEFKEAFMKVVSGLDLHEITFQPPKEPMDIQHKYDDPFRQAEYIYSQTQIDDFDHQTKKLLANLQDIPADFDGGFMSRIIKRIDVSHDGTATFALINDKRFTEELDMDDKA